MWRRIYRRRSRSSHVTLLIGLLLVPAVSRAETPLTLRDAIAYSLAHNEQYQIALAGRERADAQIVSARAGLFPRADLYGRYNRALKLPTFVIAGQSFTIGTRHSTNGGITAEQTLFEGGGVFAAWRVAQSYRQMQVAVADAARLELEAAVAGAFHATILAQALADVAARTVAQAEAHYRVVDQMFRSGLVSEYDHLRAHVRVAAARPQMIEAENNARLAMMQLKNLIGLGADDAVTLIDSEPDSSTWESWDLDSLVAYAQTRRPDLIASAHEVRARAKGVSIFKAERYPSLKLNGSFDWAWNTDERWGLRDREMSRSFGVGLSLTYNLFDGFRREGNIQSARIDLKESELRRAELLRRVVLDIESARSRFREATERLGAQHEAVAEAERGLEIANTRYQSGVGTQLEVLDAQVALAAARVLAETARHDRWIARVNWRRAMGDPVLASLHPESTR